VESNWRVAETGKKRRYYRIKKSGRAALDDQRAPWHLANRVHNRLWKEAPCLT
jgi:DNA-binding PadR family transcriptional regulator